MENEFLTRIKKILADHLSDEQFGVSELAGRTGMSRSNLLRRIKKQTGLSASQYIRNMRLEKAMEMLKDNSLTVSEISYRVGFSSTSYFIKCFREYYGYPPGEAAKREEAPEINEEQPEKTEEDAVRSGGRKKVWAIWLAVIAATIVATYYISTIVTPGNKGKQDEYTDPAIAKKSIAVLPFINDSDDTTNVYIINGLMEAVLNKLQKINDLRVISRTSVEKYRDKPALSSEIARELNTDYLVEGSGQKIGDRIVLSVQLIDAPGDKHLWSEQYSRHTSDIFRLQNEVAASIANQIKVIITPEEKARIEKAPTNNLDAYDRFLKGLDLFFKGNAEGLIGAITYFKKALALDPAFARANADVAIAYYYLDMYQSDKIFPDSISKYADRSMYNDPQLPQSLVAKAFSFMENGSYELALPYLEKALEFDPNSTLVLNTLTDYYANRMPDAEKYLEYAVKGTRLNIAAYDSVTAGIIYLHVSNAFIQNGFTKEAEYYIDKSLGYDPANIYSAYVRAYILYAENGDLQQTKDLLIHVLAMDTNRLDVMQEVGKICYYRRNYKEAYKYYRRFIDIRKSLQLDIYRSEDARIAVVLANNGLQAESDSLLADFFNYADNDQSIYRHLSLAMYYAYTGKPQLALEHMGLFSQQETYHYWTVLFLDIDPLVDNIRDLPGYKKYLEEIDKKFRKHHDEIKQSLKEKGLI